MWQLRLVLLSMLCLLLCVGGEAPRQTTTKMVSSDTRPISSISQSEDTLPPRDVPQQPPLDAVESPDDREAPRYQVNPQTDLTTLINTLIGNTDKLQKGMDKMSGWMHSSFVEVKSDMASLRT